MSGVTEAAVIPTPASLEQCVRDLAQGDSRHVLMLRPSFKDRMDECGVDMRAVLVVLRKGRCVLKPWRDQYGDWRVMMRRRVDDRRVHVEVAVRGDHLVCTTTCAEKAEEAP